MNMFKYNKLSLFFIMAIISLSFCCVENVYASDKYTTNICEHSEEYIAWSQLSEEDRNNTQMPPICDLKATESNKLKSSVRKSFDAFNKVRLPATYDIRNTDNEATMRDQMDTGSCWAFSAATSLEIYAKKNLDIEQVYSARHIEYATSANFLNGKVNEWGFNRTVGDGGNVIISSAYLTSHVGPVLESDMPFENNEETIAISEIQNLETQLDVNSVNLDGLHEHAPCNESIILDMKERIQKTGALASSVHFSGLEQYYNYDTGALYYNGLDYSNHAITIIGWDDNYAVSNFSSINPPASAGAWIVQNSWGEDFGIDGYNYVSYYDERICSLYMSLEDVDAKVEDNSYIHDKLGHNIALGYETYNGTVMNSGHGMVVFDKSNKTELLTEVTFGTIGDGRYKIYFTEGNGSTKNVSDMTLIGEGTVTYGGYLTHKLDNPVYIKSTVEQFSIVVEWTLNTNDYPIPLGSGNYIEYFNLNVEPGMSYISYLGDIWEDNYARNAIVSIKAFTDDIDYLLDVQVNSVGNNDDVIDVELSINANNVFKEDVSFVVKNSNDDVIDDVVVSLETDVNDIPTSASLLFENGLDNGNYYIDVYYQNSYIQTVDFTVLFGLVSNKYTISSTEKTIYVSSPVTIANFLNNIDGNVGGVTKSGNAVSSGYVGTGMKIDDYVIILRGDVTGDGLIKVNDVMMISKYTVEGTGLEKKYLQKAADVTGDNLVKVNDVMKISKYTVEGGTL